VGPVGIAGVGVGTDAGWTGAGSWDAPKDERVLWKTSMLTALILTIRSMSAYET